MIAHHLSFRHFQNMPVIHYDISREQFRKFRNPVENRHGYLLVVKDLSCIQLTPPHIDANSKKRILSRQRRRFGLSPSSFLFLLTLFLSIAKKKSIVFFPTSFISIVSLFLKTKNHARSSQKRTSTSCIGGLRCPQSWQ